MAITDRKTLTEALAVFEDRPLKDAAGHLLNILGYRSERTVKGPDSSPKSFFDLFSAFPSERAFDQEKALVSDWKTADLLFQLTDQELSRESSLFTDTSVQAGLLKSYVFIAIELKGSEYARGKLSATGCGHKDRYHLSYYRYCLDCVREQRLKYGEAYWTRDAQVAGFTHCPFHGYSYVNSAAPKTYSKCFSCLEDALVFEKTEVRLYPRHQKELIQLSKEGLVLSEILPTWDSQSLDSSYWRLFLEQGLTVCKQGTAKSLARTSDLIFGTDYLKSVHSYVVPTHQSSWITRFLNAPSSERDPIRHLIMLQTIGVTVDKLLRHQLLLSQPQNQGEIDTCINPICTGFRQAICEQRVLSTNLRKNSTKTRVTCKICRQVSDRASNFGSVSKSTRIVDRGSLWQEQLTLLWTDPEVSIRSLGTSLGVESLTVKRHARALGLHFPRLGPRICTVAPAPSRPKKDTRTAGLTYHRKEWRHATGTTSTTTQARKLAQGTYAWLNRYDKRWLAQYNADRITPSTRARREVNWDERQTDFLQKIDSAKIDILRREPARLCSANAMLIEIHALKYGRYIEKMPLLRMRLLELAEDRVSFALRRIDIAKNDLGPGCTRTRLIERAGLRSELLKLEIIERSLMIPANVSVMPISFR